MLSFYLSSFDIIVLSSHSETKACGEKTGSFQCTFVFIKRVGSLFQGTSSLGMWAESVSCKPAESEALTCCLRCAPENPHSFASPTKWAPKTHGRP